MLSTQREREDESDLLYYRARHYSPRLGRFIQNDPLRGNRPFKHYAYVGNNPVARIDPLGRDDRLEVTAVFNKAEQEGQPRPPTFEVYYVNVAPWGTQWMSSEGEPELLGTYDTKTDLVKMSNGRYASLVQLEIETEKWDTDWDTFRGETAFELTEEGLLAKKPKGLQGALIDYGSKIQYTLALDGSEPTKSIGEIADAAATTTHYAADQVKALLVHYATIGLPLSEGVQPLRAFQASRIKFFTVKTSTGGGVQLSKEAQAGIRSLGKRIAEHEQKLASFRANPTPRPGTEGMSAEIQMKSIAGRIKKLEHEIQVFKDNIEKLKEIGK